MATVEPPSVTRFLPSVFLAGAQKSGTTALAELLAGHPHVCLSVPKEPSLFSSPRYPESLNGYRGTFPSEAQVEGIVRLDASTCTMADRNAAERIFQVCGPGTKFLFILRRPAERAYSAFTYLKTRGHDRRSLHEVFGGLPATLAGAIAEEEARIETGIATGRIDLAAYEQRYWDARWNFRYIHNSCYELQIEPFERRFGKEAILRLDFGRLKRDPANVFDEATAFLGLPRTSIDLAPLDARNPTYVARSQAILATARMAGRAARAVLPGQRLEGVARVLRCAVLKKPDLMPPPLRAHLDALLEQPRSHAGEHA